jgi:hypothetical protein
VPLGCGLTPGYPPAYAGAMRWDALFTDLEAQLAAGERLDLEAEIADRMRADAAAVELADRLRGSLGLRIGVEIVSGSRFEGTLSHAGSQALVLHDPRRQVLIPYAAAVQYEGLARLAVREQSKVRQQLGLASALRGLSRNRTRLWVLAVRWAGPETALHGVIDKVGRDHLDLAVTEDGEDRRESNVRKMVTVPFSALAAIRSDRNAED